MKNIVIDPVVSQNPEWNQAVKASTKVLEEVLGPSAPLVEADWSKTQDERGRPWLLLRITDLTGAAEAKFAPEELKNAPHLRDRLHWLWGDLLQDRSEKLAHKLRETVQQLRGD